MRGLLAICWVQVKDGANGFGFWALAQKGDVPAFVRKA